MCGCVIGVGIAYSQFFYPVMRRHFAPPKVVVEMPRERVAVIKKNLRRNFAEGFYDATIRTLRVRGATGAEAEARMVWAVRYLMNIAEGGTQ